MYLGRSSQTCRTCSLNCRNLNQTSRAQIRLCSGVSCRSMSISCSSEHKHGQALWNAVLLRCLHICLYCRLHQTCILKVQSLTTKLNSILRLLHRLLCLHMWLCVPVGLDSLSLYCIDFHTVRRMWDRQDSMPPVASPPRFLLHQANSLECLASCKVEKGSP